MGLISDEDICNFREITLKNPDYCLKFECEELLCLEIYHVPSYFTILFFMFIYCFLF